jgi:activator of HSP90 ATPase
MREKKKLVMRWKDKHWESLSGQRIETKFTILPMELQREVSRMWVGKNCVWVGKKW